LPKVKKAQTNYKRNTWPWYVAEIKIIPINCVVWWHYFGIVYFWLKPCFTTYYDVRFGWV
jgi:hypothetical protein